MSMVTDELLTLAAQRLKRLGYEPTDGTVTLEPHNKPQSVLERLTFRKEKPCPSTFGVTGVESTIYCYPKRVSVCPSCQYQETTRKEGLWLLRLRT